VSSYSLGTVKEDRLSFEGGTLAGANDLAMLLILGAPFFLVPILSRNSSRIGKAAALVLGAIVLVVVVRSASRSGLLALVAILLVLFWSRPFAGKLKLGLLSIALIAAFLAVTPREILSRYSTLFTDADNGDEIATSAQESSMVRQHLLQQSLRLTMEHPIFGLGPGIFAVGEAKLAREEGEKATWHVSHNSYTQVSSETGIPGFLFYLAAIWTTFGNIFWFRSHGRGDATGRTSAIGMALLLSLISLCVTLLFSSSAYLPYMPMLMGLSVAFRSSLQWEMSLQSHSPALAVPQPTVAVAGPVPPVVTSSGKPIYRFLGRPRRSGA
jgi:O-antigen ligase